MTEQHSSLNELVASMANYGSERRVEVTFSCLVKRRGLLPFSQYVAQLSAQRSPDDLKVSVLLPKTYDKDVTLRERIRYRPVDVLISGRVAAVQTFCRALSKYEESRNAH